MGMNLALHLPPASTVEWTSLIALLAERSFPIQMRMIDGQLAFPDELPPENWGELRVNTPGGMVTLRRTPTGLDLVIWGNADQSLLQSRNTLAWAYALTAGGTIETPTGASSPDEFAQSADLADSVRSKPH